MACLQKTGVTKEKVKYGLDAAGALERYGAAKKSFEQATRENRRVVNIYLPAVITPELRKRIDDDRLVNQDFNLIEVFTQSALRQRFLESFKRLIGL